MFTISQSVRHCIRVVRDGAKVAGRCEIAPRNWNTLSVNVVVLGTFFESGKENATKEEERVPPFICCTQDKVGH